MSQNFRTHAIVCLASLFLGSVQLKATPTQSLFCQHYVTQEIPFCEVTLFLTETGMLEKKALIRHQGSEQTTLIRSTETQPGEMFHLFLDADKPGHEIEMIVEDEESAEGQWKAVLINHEVPFGKKMWGHCEFKSP
ncbi:hypothetical protein EBR03_05370 [bacterium]|nr:hypothetical protein [bacterium]NBW98982.1 hypothetical protein [bacterium]NBX81754.1 hypothetical protein [bacterium]